MERSRAEHSFILPSKAEVMHLGRQKERAAEETLLNTVIQPAAIVWTGVMAREWKAGEKKSLASI